MRNFRLLVCALSALTLFSCRPGARVDGCIGYLADSSVVFKLIDNRGVGCADTVHTDSRGNFSYRIGVEKDSPLFVDLYDSDKRLLPLLLFEGDRARLEYNGDLGFSIEGSQESSRLSSLERDYTAFLDAFNSAESIAGQNRIFIDHHKACVKYVLENPKSLTCIPVLGEKIRGESIFSQTSDAFIFSMVCDSLEKVYPSSPYVKSLRRDTDGRMAHFDLLNKIRQMPQQPYPDLILPDNHSVKRKLSETEAEATLLYFWNSADAVQKMFNLETLLPLWNKYKESGFEIYAVSIDRDKGLWNSVVDAQKLPWINVNDGLGTESAALRSYNISRLPSAFIIYEGKLAKIESLDSSSLDELVSGLLK